MIYAKALFLWEKTFTTNFISEPLALLFLKTMRLLRYLCGEEGGIKGGCLQGD
jgi:hypothetical protein